MSWGKIYCDTNWGENKYRTAGSIINEATPDCFQFPEFVSFKDHVRSEGATYEKMQCGIDILLFLGRSISITPQSPDNPTFSGILDTYTGATAGYSTRRLTNTYTGGLIRVRRSSDDAEQDIGYDSNGEDLDTFGLLAFVNAEYDHIDEDFSSDLGWTFFNGTSNISGGTLNFNTSTNDYAFYSYGAVPNQVVDIEFTISNYVSGGIFMINFGGGYSSPTYSANQTVTLTDINIGNGNQNWGFRAFGSFVGSIDNFKVTVKTADGHVTTFYDQTGNGNHATNSTASEQPLIVDGGDIIYEGAIISRPAIEFDGVDDYLAKITTFTINGEHMILAVHTPEGVGGYVFSMGYNDPESVMLWSSVGSYSRYWMNASSDQLNSGESVAGQRLTTGEFVSGTQTLYIDGTQNSTKSTTYSGGDVPDITIAYAVQRAQGSNFLVGKVQELIFFNSDQSSNRTGIEGNIDNYFRITS